MQHKDGNRMAKGETGFEMVEKKSTGENLRQF